MRIPSFADDREIETVAELRQLYRASEARAARLRLLSSSGRAMAEAGTDGVEAVLEHVAAQLAYFVGRPRATLSFDPDAAGIAIMAPGRDHRPVARIDIEGLSSIEDIADSEDRDAFRMYIEMLGATVDRINRERERTALLDTLQEREQRLEYLVGRIFSAQEDERRRVSHDLHDGVAQTATALARLLEGGRSLPEADLPAAERGRLAAIARDLVTELRRVIAGLRPTLLDDLGLEAAVRSLGDMLSADGFDVALTVESSGSKLPPNTEIALFRVAQEAVSNIRKHAHRGCRVEIELHIRVDGEGISLRIEDFGADSISALAGHAAKAPGEHVGIDVMRERMAAIGGRLLWKAKPEGGVSVLALCGGDL